MKLEELLAPYKHFAVATVSENEEILNFFRSMNMETSSLSLRYERGPDFFAFLKEQCEEAIIFTMKNSDGSIQGLGSVVLIRHFIDGKEELCAYLGDLRISPKLNAKIRLRWKTCYAEIIENFKKLEEFKGVRYLYSAILDDNMQALRSLLRNNEKMVYHPLTTYETVNIYAYKLIAPFPNIGLGIEKKSFQEVRDFLSQNSQGPGFNYFFKSSGEDELTRRLSTWKSFNSDSFINVINNNGDIILSCAPWQCETKKLVVTKISKFYQTLGSLVFPLLGIPKLKTGGEIKTLYLSNLVFKNGLTGFERTQALSLLIKSLLKNPKRDFHLVSFFDYPQWKLGTLPFFSQRTKATLFQVMSLAQYNEGEFIDLKNNAPAFGLEVA